MKKLTYIIAAVLLISVSSISGVALAADETVTNEAPVSQGITISVPFQDAIDAHKKGVSIEVDDDGNYVHGSGDPLKGLNVAREKNKKAVATDGDDNGDHVHGSGDPLKGLNVTRAKK